jgi:hypothetical protein
MTNIGFLRPSSLLLLVMTRLLSSVNSNQLIDLISSLRKQTFDDQRSKGRQFPWTITMTHVIVLIDWPRHGISRPIETDSKSCTKSNTARSVANKCVIFSLSLHLSSLFAWLLFVRWRMLFSFANEIDLVDSGQHVRNETELDSCCIRYERWIEFRCSISIETVACQSSIHRSLCTRHWPMELARWTIILGFDLWTVVLCLSARHGTLRTNQSC